MNKTVILIAHIIIISIVKLGCVSKKQNPSLKDRIDKSISNAKLTIRKVFVFSSNYQFDSLKSIIPSISFESINNENLKLNFRDFYQVVKVDGLPDTSLFKAEKMPDENTRYLVLKFVPISKDSLLLDSVKFTFVSPLTEHKIWKYELFKNPKWIEKMTTISTQ